MVGGRCQVVEIPLFVEEVSTGAGKNYKEIINKNVELQKSKGNLKLKLMSFVST